MPPQVNGTMIDQFSMMIQAAISGMGFALLPDYLDRVEIAEDRLCPVLTPSVPGIGAYWLAWPLHTTELKPMNAFRNWLSATPE